MVVRAKAPARGAGLVGWGSVIIKGVLYDNRKCT